MNDNQIVDILLSVRGGNKDDYLRVVEHFETRIRAFIAVRCYDRFLVDELVQDVFIYAYRHLDEYKDGTNFQAWLYAIARIRTLNELKKKIRFAKAHNNYLDYILTSGAEENFDTKTKDSSIFALEKCLKKTGVDAIRFLRFRYEKKMNHREIAEFYGRSESWAKTYFLRLKKMLRKCMEKNLDNSETLESERIL